MKNSVSDHSFYDLESEEEEDEEKEFRKGEEDDGDESDSSGYSEEIQPQNIPSSYNTAWPQSYRQSIDLYSSVPSPGIGFLGTPTLSRFGSSFLNSSVLTRRHTPEVLPTVTRPLLDPVEDERKSSHTLLPPIPPSRRSSILKKDDKATSRVSYDHHPITRQSSFGQTVLNGINVLCGVGILSTPYAAKEGGWAGLLILFVFAGLSFYTGMLLRYCLDSKPGLQTYPDIGFAAFGNPGRIIISIILYAELYTCCIEYIILESDNLSSLFPNAHLTLGGFHVTAKLLFAVIATIAVLPTVWLRDLTILSYISAGGVIASILAVACLFYVGVVDGVGVGSSGTVLNLQSLPVAIGLYGYCYSGHAVFPNIYTSMAKPSQYTAVLLVCFIGCTLTYAGVAVLGYTMFGEATESQFTLNMPQDLIATKVAVWTTVVNPFTKYALTMMPVAMSLEELIPTSQAKSHHIYSMLIRTALVASTLAISLCIPFFGLVMALIGSLLTMLVTLILPCACFLSILRGKITRTQGALCTVIIVVGVISAGFGSYSALSKIIENLMA